MPAALRLAFTKLVEIPWSVTSFPVRGKRTSQHDGCNHVVYHPFLHN